MTDRTFVSIILLLAACTPPQRGAETVPALQGPRLPGSFAANIVVEGVVTDTSPGQYVLAITGLVRAPESLGDLRGSRLTVLVPADQRPAVGERATVFGAVVVVGSGVTVREVIRYAASLDSLRSGIAQAEQAQLDSLLSDGMRRAERVVYGRVERIADSSATDTRDSEHNPVWHVAIIRVRETLKGPVLPTAVVWFPSSRDVMWIDAPRFTEGQEGIWILRSGPSPGRLSALGRWDFQLPSELPRLRRLRPDADRRMP